MLQATCATLHISTAKTFVNKPGCFQALIIAGKLSMIAYLVEEGNYLFMPLGYLSHEPVLVIVTFQYLINRRTTIWDILHMLLNEYIS